VWNWGEHAVREQVLERHRGEHPGRGDDGDDHGRADRVPASGRLRRGTRDLAVAREREDPSSGRGRRAQADGHHVEQHDELQEVQHEVRGTAEEILRSEREEGSRGDRGIEEHGGIEAEPGDVRVGGDDVEDRDDENRQGHGSGDGLLGTLRLLGEVRRGLEAHEDQHAIEHAEQDPRVAGRLGGIERPRAVLGRVDDHVHQERKHDRR
jgi:hypothetical protein